MKRKFSERWKRILTMGANSRREFVIGYTIWVGGVLFVALIAAHYFLHTLTIWTVLFEAIVSAFAGFLGARGTWWWIGKLGLRR